MKLGLRRRLAHRHLRYWGSGCQPCFEEAREVMERRIPWKAVFRAFEEAGQTPFLDLLKKKKETL